MLKDPYAQREAAKYDNPIPSREHIFQVLDNAPGPMTHEQLCEVLGLGEEEQIEALRRRLIAMVRDGQLISNRRNGYACIDKLDLIRGRVLGHKDGYGFVVPHEGGDDIYLHNRQMRRVFDGDEVLVRLAGEYRGKQEGKIVEVLAHNTHQLVGRYFVENGIHFVRPDNPRLVHDVMIAPGDGGGARKGQFVVVEITHQPARQSLPAGRIIEVMGDHMAPGMEIDVAIRAHRIPHLWPSDVQAEAAMLPAEVAEADKLHRVDLRHLPLVTIDGEDARDFDDAVYCESKKSGGWRLYVAIADVSHYVTRDGALDREAVVRGNSVYFPDFVVPMLPEALSNGLCSLNPQVDRLCMVCEMTVSEAGRVSGYKFYEGVMHSHARLTYTQVGLMLEAKGSKRKGLLRRVAARVAGMAGRDGGAAAEVADLRRKFAAVAPHVDELHNLYQALRAARDARGAIDFETTETRILFDESRKIDRIVPVERNDAHKLIEECMLSANVCAARFLEKHGIPALYRVHEGPGEEKLGNLHEFLGELGLSMRGGKKPKPRDFQEVLLHIGDRPDAHLIQTVMLRSMSQAVYQPDNEGHFGLGYTAYTHFTSPIRRYPDLLVHRAIRYVVRSNIESKQVKRVEGAKPLPQKNIYPYGLEEMLKFGESSSMTERRADEATRDVTSWLKCEYLQDHVGDVFEGVVSGVTGFGLFVELKDIYVDGLVHITALPHDYYHFDAAQHRLVGERTRRMFRLGDELVVRVVRVDLDDRKIDFELEEVQPRRRKKKVTDRDDKVEVSGRARQLADEFTQGQARKGKKSAAAKKVRSKKKTASSSGAGADQGVSPKGALAKKTKKNKTDSKGHRVRKAKTAKPKAAKARKSAPKKAVPGKRKARK